MNNICLSLFGTKEEISDKFSITFIFHYFCHPIHAKKEQ